MSVYKVKRATAKGDRWYVRAELPGMRCIHLGTFDSKTRADTRIKTALDEIAQGRTPQRFADAPLTIERTVGEWAQLWLASRLGAADETLRGYERVVRNLPAELAHADPATLTHADVQAWIVSLTKRPHRRVKSTAKGLARGSIAGEVMVLKLVLDYAGVEHNPARDRRVQLPRAKRQPYRLPTRDEIAELHRLLPTRVPVMQFLEWTGVRISEAAALTYEDIDYKRDRFLVRQSKTAAGRRWVDRLPGAPPLPEQGSASLSARVFSKPSPDTLSNVLAQAHRRHGTAPITSHSFRHLAASRLLHEQVLSPAQIAARLGHANPSVTLTTYSWVLPPD